jgi:hypothetical protein
LGVVFPDGMIVLDPPTAGYMTDPMAWTNSQINVDINAINITRVRGGLERVHLYGDKIFRTDMNLIAAYSAFNGVVQDWMTNLNFIMSKLRVSIEWCYGKIKYLFKSITLKTCQRLMKNQPVEDMILSSFFTNCRTCYQYDGPYSTTFTNCVPPTIHDYIQNQN